MRGGFVGATGLALDSGLLLAAYETNEARDGDLPLSRAFI